jgi:sulfate/thiosulfate transport system substrate-binding protein
MKSRHSETKDSFIQHAKQQILKVAGELGYIAQGRSTRSSALLLATGISLSIVLPAQSAPPDRNTQLVSQAPKTTEITLVTYAVTKEAYDKIIPLFVEKWKREKGQDIKINSSYGGSGSQTRAVLDGLEADVVALALSLDTKRLEKAGLIQPGWEKEVPNGAIVTRSVVALVTRPGNPKGIRTWADLTKPGVSVITANPKTSGVARWNFLALWGSVGNNEQQATDYVRQVFKGVPVLAKDAREASDFFFKKGQGDVLLNYENEIILAGQKGQGSSFFVIPQTNISIDAPVAVVDKVADKRGSRPIAEAFVQFLFTPEAQREFAKVGFRPVIPTVTKEVEKKFPKITKLYTAQDFGGWDAIQKKFFDDGAVFDQIYNTR